MLIVSSLYEEAAVYSRNTLKEAQQGQEWAEPHGLPTLSALKGSSCFSPSQRSAGLDWALTGCFSESLSSFCPLTFPTDIFVYKKSSNRSSNVPSNVQFLFYFSPFLFLGSQGPSWAVYPFSALGPDPVVSFLQSADQTLGQWL